MDVVSPILDRARAKVIDKLIDKVSTYVQDQYYWKANLQEELQNLKRLLPQIQAVVGFAEDKLTMYESHNPALIKWLWQFRDDIDEAEEVLDELEYRELEKKYDGDKSTRLFMVSLGASCLLVPTSHQKTYRFHVNQRYLVGTTAGVFGSDSTAEYAYLGL
ncbi:uncharacterized protein LOC122031791 isoform X2 [Zingiber officinale]|uniref:uncharacterized protein LOC122031791 isoform X2 n=1 Tax=Zingiber officinale TaxID=94328 RepID=UPI001C4C8833|nr:uncharacterized protein LOC122031791 isoform X2 [Zingiber officinale]